MSQSIQHTPTPELGKYDFDGQCAPHQPRASGSGWNATFTLGIFEWEAKAGGKGLKRGKVLVRVKGDFTNPGPAYEEARDRCARLNEKPSGIIPKRAELPEPKKLSLVMAEKKRTQIKRADLTVGARLYRNGERNEVFAIRSVDTRKGLARAGFEAELYLNYGSGEKVRWRTVAEIQARYTLLK